MYDHRILSECDRYSSFRCDQIPRQAPLLAIGKPKRVYRDRPRQDFTSRPIIPTRHAETKNDDWDLDTRPT